MPGKYMPVVSTPIRRLSFNVHVLYNKRMTPLMLFGLLVLVPVVLAMLLRINAAVLFMSLCVGEVLVQYVASDTGSFVATFAGHSSNISTSTIRLALLLVPPVLTAIFMFHSVHGGTKLIFNIF